jgi:hypothetical protein
MSVKSSGRRHPCPYRSSDASQMRSQSNPQRWSLSFGDAFCRTNGTCLDFDFRRAAACLPTSSRMITSWTMSASGNEPSTSTEGVDSRRWARQRVAYVHIVDILRRVSGRWLQCAWSAPGVRIPLRYTVRRASAFILLYPTATCISAVLNEDRGRDAHF